MTSYNLLDTLLADNLNNYAFVGIDVTDTILLFTKMTCKLNGEPKMYGVNKCLVYLRNIFLFRYNSDSFNRTFSIFFNIIQILCYEILMLRTGKSRSSDAMMTQYVNLIHIMEMAFRLHVSDSALALLKLQRARVNLKLGFQSLDDTWLLYLNVYKSLKLTHALIKPEENIGMMQIIAETMKNIVEKMQNLNNKKKCLCFKVL
jgi:hypothetical protein